MKVVIKRLWACIADPILNTTFVLAVLIAAQVFTNMVPA
jgi:hypothetical protein